MGKNKYFFKLKLLWYFDWHFVHSKRRYGEKARTSATEAKAWDNAQETEGGCQGDQEE